MGYEEKRGWGAWIIRVRAHPDTNLKLTLSDPRLHDQQCFDCCKDPASDNQDPNDQATTILSILPRHGLIGEPSACKSISIEPQRLISELMAHRVFAERL